MREMNVQRDLFQNTQAALVAGLTLVEDAVSPAYETALTSLIDAAPLEPFKFGQWRGKRVTVHYGSGYDFTRHRLDPAEPLPEWLIELRDQLAPLAGLDPADFVAALLIRYDPGAGIGWHRDRPQYGEVLGLSLGAPSILRLRRRSGDGFERRNVPLPPRSLYHLSGEVRWEWEHSLAPQDATRWSVTLRTLRERG
jgi:alkylated DNA repair dioxygenase AlkB